MTEKEWEKCVPGTRIIINEDEVCIVMEFDEWYKCFRSSLKSDWKEKLEACVYFKYENKDQYGAAFWVGTPLAPDKPECKHDFIPMFNFVCCRHCGVPK